MKPEQAPKLSGQEKRLKKRQLEADRASRDLLIRQFRTVGKTCLTPVDTWLARIKLEKNPSNDRVVARAREIERDLIRDFQEVKEKVAKLERGHHIEWPQDGRYAVYSDSDEAFTLRLPNGSTIMSTKGQLIASLMWNAKYRFDYHTPTIVQLEILVLQAIDRFTTYSKRIHSLLESVNWYNLGGAYTKADSYSAMHEELAKSPSEWPAGLIAERMALGLLRQVNVECEIHIAPADPQANFDIESKIDILLIDEQESYYGIQFVSTAYSGDSPIIQHKERQLQSAQANMAVDPVLQRVKKLFLVAVDMGAVDPQSLYREWERTRDKRAGGPEQLLPNAIKKEIVVKCLGPVIGDEIATKAADKVFTP